VVWVVSDGTTGLSFVSPSACDLVVVVVVVAGVDVLFLKGQESGVRDAVMFFGQSCGRRD
jgi:hypothetical protein